MLEKKRGSAEIIILSISSIAALALIPILLVSANSQHWSSIALFVGACVGAAGLLCYAYLSSKIQQLRWLLALGLSASLIAVLVVKGASFGVWLFPALLVVYILLPAKQALLLCLLTICLGSAALWSELNATTISQWLLASLSTALIAFACCENTQKQQQYLQNLSNKDPLTGAGNRRAMELKLLELLSRKRHNSSQIASLILIDLDRFKQINDQYGHHVGDQILQSFCQLVSRHLRVQEELFRLGGEEFVITLNHKNLQQAANLAEDIREAVEQFLFIEQLHITISLGIAECNSEESSLEWLKRADHAMYKAKDAGRNLACIAA